MCGIKIVCYLYKNEIMKKLLLIIITIFYSSLIIAQRPTDDVYFSRKHNIDTVYYSPNYKNINYNTQYSWLYPTYNYVYYPYCWGYPTYNYDFYSPYWYYNYPYNQFYYPYYPFNYQFGDYYYGPRKSFTTPTRINHKTNNNRQSNIKQKKYRSPKYHNQNNSIKYIRIKTNKNSNKDPKYWRDFNDLTKPAPRNRNSYPSYPTPKTYNKYPNQRPIHKKR